MRSLRVRGFKTGVALVAIVLLLAQGFFARVAQVEASPAPGTLDALLAASLCVSGDNALAPAKGGPADSKDGKHGTCCTNGCPMMMGFLSPLPFPQVSDRIAFVLQADQRVDDLWLALRPANELSAARAPPAA